jgi:predicted solute-binding protein
MRTPVRPDQIDRTPVRLLDTSGTAELLARAILRPFYGIAATSWVTSADDPAAAEAQVVIVEGAEALRLPEAGFSEDLCRAWLILTDTPAVSHVLLAPLAADAAALTLVLDTLAAIQRPSTERRRHLHAHLADRDHLDRARLAAFFARQRYALDPPDRDGLLQLLRRGGRGSSYPAPTALRFWPPEDRPGPG